MEPRESGSSKVRRETPRLYIGGVRREAHAVGRWVGVRVRVSFMLKARARIYQCWKTGLELGLGLYLGFGQNFLVNRLVVRIHKCLPP